jgi:hypothetical protein
MYNFKYRYTIIKRNLCINVLIQLFVSYSKQSILF